MTHHSEPAEAVARIIKRVQQYDTPKMDDHRRRYTPAQLEMAIRLALAASPAAPDAAGVAASAIPRAPNAGRYLAETNGGRLLYLNHAGEWHEMPNILAPGER